MYCIQEMMHEQHYEEPSGNKTILPAIIKPKLASAQNCIVPPCHLCLLARAKKHTPNVLWTQLLDDCEGAITRDQYNVGDFVSTEQFICKTPRRLPTGYGRESQDCRFQGCTIFNDAASGLIWVKNQISLGANKTVMGKARFKQWLYDQCVCEVKHYHRDNSIFSAEEFWCDCKEKQQSQSLLVPNTRICVLNVLFRPSCIWCKRLWFMPPFSGQKEVQTISLSGPLL
jgi:hypothetical protein